MNCSKNSDFLASQISAKESDLECPMCLEISEAPIYTCLEQHIICSKCWIKVTSRFGHFKVERWQYVILCTALNFQKINVFEVIVQ